jgi:hypothetical protein
MSIPFWEMDSPTRDAEGYKSCLTRNPSLQETAPLFYENLADDSQEVATEGNVAQPSLQVAKDPEEAAQRA